MLFVRYRLYTYWSLVIEVVTKKKPEVWSLENQQTDEQFVTTWGRRLQTPRTFTSRRLKLGKNFWKNMCWKYCSHTSKQSLSTGVGKHAGIYFKSSPQTAENHLSHSLTNIPRRTYIAGSSSEVPPARLERKQGSNLKFSILPKDHPV